MPFSFYYAARAPWLYAIEPRNQAIGVNFIFGIMGGYGTWKALEWGLAQDLTPYAFVGFDDKEGKTEESKPDQGGKANRIAKDSGNFTEQNGNGGAGKSAGEVEKKNQEKAAHKKHVELRRVYLEGVRRRQAKEENGWQIVKSTLHLLYSMRGNGYEFAATTTTPFPRQEGPFLRRLLLEIGWSHPLLVLCSATLLEPARSRDLYVYVSLFCPASTRMGVLTLSAGFVSSPGCHPTTRISSVKSRLELPSAPRSSRLSPSASPSQHSVFSCRMSSCVGCPFELSSSHLRSTRGSIPRCSICRDLPIQSHDFGASSGTGTPGPNHRRASHPDLVSILGSIDSFFSRAPDSYSSNSNVSSD